MLFCLDVLERKKLTIILPVRTAEFSNKIPTVKRNYWLYGSVTIGVEGRQWPWAASRRDARVNPLCLVRSLPLLIDCRDLGLIVNGFQIILQVSAFVLKLWANLNLYAPMLKLAVNCLSCLSGDMLHRVIDERVSYPTTFFYEVLHPSFWFAWFFFSFLFYLLMTIFQYVAQVIQILWHCLWTRLGC